MDLEQAKQFLSDLSHQWSQPDERKQAFLEWQQNALAEELAELDEWHQQLLIRQKGDLDADAEMMASNRAWLEEELDDFSNQEKSVQRGTVRIRYILRIAAAAVVAGLLIAGGYLFINRTSSSPASPMQASSGLNAVLTLAGGRQIMLADVEKGVIATEGGVRILKLDSGRIGYEAEDGKGGVPYNMLTTGKGGRYEVLLPDGSHVWLNCSATLTYPISFSGKARNVELNGEAYFEIAKKEMAPFTVKAGGTDVQVLGTGFNVMAYPEEAAVRTTLVEGAVAVSKGGRKVVIKPGQQATLARGTDSIHINTPYIEEVLAWRQGEFRFRKASVQSIMRQMERWYDIKVIYKGTISTAPFTGVMTRKEDYNQLLEVLEVSGDVHFEVTGNTISVLTGPR